MAPVILGKYQDIMDDYFMTSFGTKDRQPRWETCIGSTLGAFGYALARPFVEQVYDKTAKAMVRSLEKNFFMLYLPKYLKIAFRLFLCGFLNLPEMLPFCL